MSTYYYFHARGTNEYFELTSGSWYPFMEDLYDVLCTKIKNHKPYSDFINTLRKKKVFEGFYDDDTDFITVENEKYFLQPLYNWAFNWAVKNKTDFPIALIEDNELYEVGIELFCQDIGIKYERSRGWQVPQHIQEAIDKYNKEHKKQYWNADTCSWITNDDADDETISDRYLKCVGKLDYDDKVLNIVGVSFEHALAELKAGASIRRKSNPTNYYFLYTDKDGQVCVGGSCEGQITTIKTVDILADDWEYSLR